MHSSKVDSAVNIVHYTSSTTYPARKGTSFSPSNAVGSLPFVTRSWPWCNARYRKPKAYRMHPLTDQPQHNANAL